MDQLMCDRQPTLMSGYCQDHSQHEEEAAASGKLDHVSLLNP